MNYRLCIIFLLLCTHITLWAQGSGENYNPKDPDDPQIYYAMSLAADPAVGGNVSPSSVTQHAKGDVIRVSASANSGFRFVCWTQGSDTLSLQSQFSYTMPADNVQLTANFIYDPTDPADPDKLYKVTLSGIPEVACSSLYGGGQYVRGAKVSLEAYPTSGFRFVNWVKDGSVFSTEARTSFLMPEEDVHLTAVFEYNPNDPDDPTSTGYGHRADFSPYPFAGGTIDHYGVRLLEGDEITVTATANPDYEFLGWLDPMENEEAAGINDSIKYVTKEPSLTIIMPDDEAYYIAVFKYVPKDDVVDAAMGDANGDGTVNYADVDLVAQMALGNAPAAVTNPENVTFTGDTRTTVIDVVGTVDVLLGKFVKDDLYYITDGDPAPEITYEKEYLEETGKAFVNKFKAADFQNLRDLYDIVMDRNYDATIFEERVDSAFEAVKTLLGDSIGNSKYGYATHYTNYRTLLRASAFTGHFTDVDGTWQYAPAEDLQCSFYDNDGNLVVARLTIEGNTKTVHAYRQSDEDYSYDAAGGSYGYNIDRYDHFVEIPEYIHFTLTRGDTTLVSTDVNIDLSSIRNEYLNSMEDGIGCTVDARINNVEVNVIRANYNSKSGAQAAVRMKMDGRTILTAGMNADGYVDVKDEYHPTFDEDIPNAGAANAWINVLGWVQMKGKISSVHKVKLALDEVNGNRSNEQNFKNAINTINNLCNVKCYYRQEPVIRGTLSQDAYGYYNWRGEEDWKTETVITFVSDQSSYALDEYFTEEAFQSFVDLFNDILDDFDTLVSVDEEDNNDYPYSGK